MKTRHMYHFQIQHFSLQMLHQKVHFNAFGFFEVDYTLVFMVDVDQTRCDFGRFLPFK